MPLTPFPTVRISGRVYPERPRSNASNESSLRRLSSIVDSLKFASEKCSEVERRLYREILEVRAHAENLLDQVRGSREVQPELSDLMRPAHEP
jgi:hypothetical protein